MTDQPIPSRRQSEIMGAIIEVILDEYTEPFRWDYNTVLMPTADGQLTPVGIFMMFLKNPLLGTGDMMTLQMLQGGVEVSEESLRRLIAATVHQLREQRSQVLAPSNGDGPPLPQPGSSGLIL